jgi:RimJ/RimL family protein N-acetyltransferase
MENQVNYELNYENLIQRNIHPDFKIVETTDDNIIENCINLFNSKIKWDDMFDLEVANNRIKMGDKMYVGYFEDNIIGYSWLKLINNHKYYIYNVFIEQDSINRNFGASDLVYLIIKYHTKGLITLDVDEWNHKAQKFAEKLGFKSM